MSLKSFHFSIKGDQGVKGDQGNPGYVGEPVSFFFLKPKFKSLLIWRFIKKLLVNSWKGEKGNDGFKGEKGLPGFPGFRVSCLVELLKSHLSKLMFLMNVIFILI